VAGLGHEPPASARWVRRLWQLVERPAPRGLREELGGPALGEAGEAAGGVDVASGGLASRRRRAGGEEERARGPPGEVAGEERGGGGVPAYGLGVTPFADHGGPPVGEVEVGDVERWISWAEAANCSSTIALSGSKRVGLTLRRG
jgi:hypothetical protein